LPAYKLKIHGKVQGVFYRDFARKQAEALDISGWAKNDSDGTVTAYIQGEEDKIDYFLVLLWSGPEASKVQNIQKEPSVEDPMITLFEIRYD